MCCFARPLADSEKLPVRVHRAAEAPKSPVEDGDAASQEPRKKSSKEKQEKKKDKDRDRKVRFKWLLFTMDGFSCVPPAFVPVCRAGKTTSLVSLNG